MTLHRCLASDKNAIAEQIVNYMTSHRTSVPTGSFVQICAAYDNFIEAAARTEPLTGDTAPNWQGPHILRRPPGSIIPAGGLILEHDVSRGTLVAAALTGEGADEPASEEAAE